MEAVSTPYVEIIYDGKDISEDVSAYVRQVEYVDNIHGRADDIDIILDDSEDIWKSKWYPTKGDSLKIKVGYSKSEMVDWGKYDIDEITTAYDSFTISAQSVAITSETVQEKKNKTYDGKTLKDVVSEIAKKNKLKLESKITPNFKFKHLTQNQEKDLAFLMGLADQFGYILKINDGKLIFYKREEVYKQAPVMTFAKEDITYYSFRDKTEGLYNACTVTYLDKNAQKSEKYEHKDSTIKSGSVHKINSNVCETKDMAKEMAIAALYDKNTQQMSAMVNMVGNPKLLAGVNITIAGLFKANGTYNITQVKHTISVKNGYTVTAQLRRVKS